MSLYRVPTETTLSKDSLSLPAEPRGGEDEEDEEKEEEEGKTSDKAAETTGEEVVTPKKRSEKEGEEEEGAVISGKNEPGEKGTEAFPLVPNSPIYKCKQ